MKKHLLLILLLAGSLAGFSQTSKVIGITTEYRQLDTINNQGDSLFDLLVTVHLVDTLNVSKVKIKIGNNYGGNNILNGTFNWYSTSSSLPSNLIYKRNYGMISFTLKNVVPSVMFYQANTEDFQSTLGTPYIRQQ